MSRQASRYASPEAVETAFYDAFRQCDAEAMMAVWSADEPLCAHPNARPLVGAEAIRRSWEHIFDQAELPGIHTRLVQRMTGGDLAVHVVEETIGPAGDPTQSALVLATNVYRREADGWLMVSHQGAVLPPSLQRTTLQ